MNKRVEIFQADLEDCKRYKYLSGNKLTPDKFLIPGVRRLRQLSVPKVIIVKYKILKNNSLKILVVLKMLFLKRILFESS